MPTFRLPEAPPPDQWQGDEGMAHCNGCCLPNQADVSAYQAWAGHELEIPDGWTWNLTWYASGRLGLYLETSEPNLAYLCMFGGTPLWACPSRRVDAYMDRWGDLLALCEKAETMETMCGVHPVTGERA